MIREDLIRAKRVSVSHEYQREVVALRRAKVRDSQVRERVQRHEDRFWLEIARASKSSSPHRIASRGERESGLRRVMEAHNTLAQAKGSQQHIVREVREQIARVVKTKHRLSVFEKAQTKAHVGRAHIRAERQAEEVDAVVSLRRLQEPTHRVQPLRRGELGCETKRGEEEVLSASRAGQYPGKMDICHGFDTHLTAEANGVHSSAERGPVIAPGLILQSVSTEMKEQGISLQVQAESAGAPVACQLRSTASDGVAIVVESGQARMIDAIEREHRGIVQRLSELGIKIGGFEIRREITMRGALAGFQRRARRSREEVDENVIA